MPRYSSAAWKGFELFFRPFMGRRLDGVHVRGVPEASWLPEIPVLLVANHTSWWDGFLLREVHRQLRPGAPFHVVMARRELDRFPFFRWLGAVSLAETPLAARSLARRLERVTARDHGVVIAYFPQGRIWPSHRRPLGFRRGGAWLASRLAPLAVIPVGIHLETLTRPGPAAFVSVGSPLLIREGIEPDRLEAAVTRETDAILQFIRRHGEDAPLYWSPS
jgi:1-acyl-sn-glycerol-3-phosphate acyltransferase